MIAEIGGNHEEDFAAVLPLLLVALGNKWFTGAIPELYGQSHSFDPAVIGSAAPVVQEVAKVSAIWAVQAALLVGIVGVVAWRGSR